MLFGISESNKVLPAGGFIAADVMIQDLDQSDSQAHRLNN